jgi:hypothetical protein
MITYTWTVKNLFTQPVGDEQNYVVTVDYVVTAVEDQYTAELGNIARFSTSSVTPFIPYEELTNDIVIGWAKNELGENGIISIEASLAGQIEGQKNPPIIPENTPLPWA